MKFVFLIALFFGTQVCAQVVDMRAFSRQRGYKAYGGGAGIVRPTVKNSVPAQGKRTIASAESASSSAADSGTSAGRAEKKLAQYSPDSDEEEAVRQKGLKVFREEDEDKVMNFVVENPDFKKLNKKQQQDLLKRIKYEKNQRR